MCTTTENQVVGETKSQGVPTSFAVATIAFCGAVTVASLVAAIVLSNKLADSTSTTVSAVPAANDVHSSTTLNTGFATMKPPSGPNSCDGAKVSIDNIECLSEALGPQAGANITKGYKGNMAVDHEPIKTPYFQTEMCAVNVHWHLGSEHLSLGEFDEDGHGPHDEDGHRYLAGDEEVRGGHRCHHYDSSDEKFTKEYDWQHCIGMEVGETYEVHWPHSAAGACGTLDQFQTPFYDGVFCNVEVFGDFSRLPQQVGVQGQVFTIVNDEAYYYPDLMRGMVLDGEIGQDIAKYTGSTTGTTRDNEICSGYSPITWQVDRKCQLVSASAFDKMCADMKSQRDDMSEDLYAHGAREVVMSDYVANNQQDRNLRGNN